MSNTQWEQVAQESVASGDEEDDQISSDEESDDDALLEHGNSFPFLG